MTSHSPPDHFQGKSISEHLREARTRGAIASAEVHGTEMPGHLAAGADSAKETAVFLTILWIFSHEYAFSFSSTLTFQILLLFSMGLVVWKMGRSAMLGWARLERLHRLIEEERWEIQHHRYQEKEELTELYRAKGFEGKLLETVVDILMADDNRLLRVMLEEELGLTLEAYEHPLKQCIGAGVGVVIAASLLLLGLWIQSDFGLFVMSLFVMIIASSLSAKLERNRCLNATIWNLSTFLLAAGAVYFLTQLLLHDD